MFNVGSEYTRDEIHELLGGSKQVYLPTVAGQVVAACLTLKFNPRAPNVILCGHGKYIASSAAALAKQREAIPVFIKRDPKRWEFHGNYKVVASYSSGAQFQELIADSGRQAADISLAIQMQRV
jgi:hypothetical protein